MLRWLDCVFRSCKQPKSTTRPKLQLERSMYATILQHLAKSFFFILQATKRRVSFEWTLIAGENAGKPRISFTGNEKKSCESWEAHPGIFGWISSSGKDTPEKAQELGKLIYVNCPGGTTVWTKKLQPCLAFFVNFQDVRICTSSKA